MTRSDNYLNLCIEQAAKSPLHYRHGAIIVRGGKVIGHGYNDYRPGFNGGTLKNGRIAHGAFDGDAVKELKSKLKKKDKNKPQQQCRQQQSGITFVPFEGTGGGHGVNQPLSMHSEMMAIYSALSASSTLSSTAFSREKPCFKLPRADKRKARLRREVLMSYVAAVSETSTRTGKAQVSREAASANNKREDRNYNNKEDGEEDNALFKQVVNNPSLAFHGEPSAEKHHHQNRNVKKNHQNGKKNGYQYQYDRYGKQIQHAQAQQQPKPSASKAKRCDDSGYDVIRGYDATITNHGDDERDDEVTKTTTSASTPSMKRKKDYRRCGKLKNEDRIEYQYGRSEPMLLPKGRTGDPGASVTDRKKHPRLKGADLYVTRVGWQGKPETWPPRLRATTSDDNVASSDAPTRLDSPEPLAESTSSLESLSTASSVSAGGSLHDELIHRHPSPSPSDSIPQDTCGFDRSNVHASRPCYRCIAFMHSVGIRRVFWTNDAGEWEGRKVAKLVENMEMSMDDVAASGDGGNGGPMGNGVFVTKHEVLMLRRMMGAKGMQ